MQGEVDGLHTEVKRRDSNLDLVSTEKERMMGRLKVEEGKYLYYITHALVISYLDHTVGKLKKSDCSTLLSAIQRNLL